MTDDHDGCGLACRPRNRAWGHTLGWGDCAHAPETACPEARVTIGGVCKAADGENSIMLESIPVSMLAERIEKALRTVPVTLGLNALGMLERGEPVRLSGGEYAAMALAVALDLAGEKS
jgi:hypothetical protein